MQIVICNAYTVRKQCSEQIKMSLNGSSLVVQSLGFGAFTAVIQVQSLIQKLRSYKMEDMSKRKKKPTCELENMSQTCGQTKMQKTFFQEVKVNWATTPSSQKKDTSSKYILYSLNFCVYCTQQFSCKHINIMHLQ